MKTNRLTRGITNVANSECTYVTAVCLTLFCQGQTWANEVSIVVPNEFANVEGNSGGSDLPGIGFRALTIFPATKFESLPESHRVVTAIAFRPNASVVEPRETDWGHVQWFLSTTTRRADGMSSVFAENHGADKTTVFDGPLTLTTQATGPPEGPRDFDYRVELQNPFFYDPTQGNLAFDILVPDGFTPSPLDDQSVRTDAWLVDFPLSNATSGAFTGNQLIVELTFVPEPATIVPLAFGLFATLAFGWRRVQRRSGAATQRRTDWQSVLNNVRKPTKSHQ